MDYYVYILKSLKDNKFYIGSCSDIESRINFHNAGLQRSTKNRIPFKLILSEKYKSKMQDSSANTQGQGRGSARTGRTGNFY